MIPAGWLYLLSAAAGLLAGSFANVCIYRLPRDQSIVRPASHCPSCLAPVKPWHNVPLAGYLILRGRCRACGRPIPARYPLVEVLTGLLFAAAAYKFGATPATLFYFVFITVMVVISFIDYDFQIIPDEITLPGIPVGMLAAWLFLPDPFGRGPGMWIKMGITVSVMGALTGFALYYAIAFLSRGGMGGGDVKMMTMAGTVLGWKGVLLTTFLASAIGSGVGLYLMAFKGKGRKTRIPFGPFLAAGVLFSLFFGREIVSWYLRYGR